MGSGRPYSSPQRASLWPLGGVSMSKFNSVSSAHFARSRTAEAIAEVGLAAGAAVFTAAIWLSVGAWGIAPQQVVQSASAAPARAVTHVTLPTVHIVGRRDSL